MNPMEKHSKRQCPICEKYVSCKNIRRHLKIHKQTNQINSVCCDKSKGIFVVDPQTSGSSKPIHVQFKTFGEMKISCSNSGCEVMLGPTTRGEHSYICKHITAVINNFQDCPNINLCNIEDVFISPKMISCVNSLQSKARSMGSPLVVKYPDSPLTDYYSVYSGDASGSNYGRILVSLKDNILHCACCRTRRTCVHKAVL